MLPYRCCLSRRQLQRQRDQQIRRMASCTCRCGKRSKWRWKTISTFKSNRSISRSQKGACRWRKAAACRGHSTITIMDAPAGVGGAAVPLLSFSSPGLAPASVDPIPPTVSSSYNTSRVLETSHSLVLGTSPYSGGSLVPGFDAQLLGRYGWLRRNPQVSLLTVTPSSATSGDTVTTDNTLGDTILTKAFSPGTTIELGVNDFVQSFYSGRSSAVPFSHPNAYALIAQPLFRNAGRGNNTRYIAIAKTNKTISSAVLEQQMISTIAGVDNLYIDLISLQDEVKVQQQALTAADQLLTNDRQQLDVGRLPPIEVARAESLVTTTRVLLEQSKALRDQQEVILRSLIDPRSLTGPDTQPPGIVATDLLFAAPCGGGNTFAGPGEAGLGYAAGCATGAVTDRERRAAGSGLSQRGQAGDRYLRDV